MIIRVGDRVVAESESTERPPRAGTVRRVLREAPSPRYEVEWDAKTFAAAKPGKGLGDANPTHPGPPGQNKDTSPTPAPTPPAPPPPPAPPSPPPANPPASSSPPADHTPPGQSKDKNETNGKGKGR